MWDVIVLIPDHCLSTYFITSKLNKIPQEQAGYIEGGMWDVIVLIPDHCLSIYFVTSKLMWPTLIFF